MSDMMTFPATVEEFMEQYKIVDDEKVYTNGADLVPIFRMMQWFEHVSATDTISRQAAIDVLDAYQVKIENGEENPYAWARLRMSELPPAQPDAVTASLEELINDYGEDGYFIIDGVNYQANELLNELKINSSVGEKFRKQITKTIVQYFMKFGG